MIRYRIELADPAAHRYDVTLTVPEPAADTELSLPVWIPGSYMVREFGRHLSGLQARQGEADCALTQRDKTTWSVQVAPQAGPLIVRYSAYAYDNSVRTAWLDTQRGFFNPTSLCLRVAGREQAPHEVQIAGLPRGWQVATGMAAAPRGRHCYRAADYDELADQPFELGPFWRGEFRAGGALHEFVVAGAWPGFDGERLLADTQRICAAQIAFWHGKGKAPFQRYVFMLNAVEDGYGGLEHRASTALIAKRSDLPRVGQGTALTDGYQTLLGLISHEYFHTWNVKRLKPREFLRYDYRQENYTRLLWFFEGFTSYYDDLFLLRAGLLDASRYLKLLGRTVNGVAATPGQAVQSVAEASFDAWVKYYRPDENTPNATVSYYTKGALIALLLDLRLRQAGAGTLDELMRALWKRCVRTGLTEDEVLAEIRRRAGATLADEFAGWVHGRSALPLAPALTALGVQVEDEPLTPWAATLGLRLNETAAGGVVIKTVLNGSAAARAGLSAGDELLALDGWRVRRLDDARAWLAPGTTVPVLISRQQRIVECRLALPGADDPAMRQVVLSLQSAPEAATAALRQDWLGA